MLPDRGKTAGERREFGVAAPPKHPPGFPRRAPAWQILPTERRTNRHQMGMPMPVSFTELSDAVQFVSAGHNEENQAYLCKASGRIYCHSEFVPDLDELPGDINDEEKYLRLPNRRDLDLGKPLVLDFAREFLPDDFDRVRDIFRKRDADAEIQASVGAKRHPRSLVRLPGESRGTGLEKVVRRQRDCRSSTDWPGRCRS